MGKIFCVILLIGSFASCGYWDHQVDCSQYPGRGGCPPGPPPPGKYGLARDISRSWLGRPINDLIKIWGEPQGIFECDRKCLQFYDSKYVGGDGKAYRWWYTSDTKWETYTEKYHFLLIPHYWERQRRVTCVLHFRVSDKGIIISEYGGQLDSCDQVIHQAMRERNWRAAPGTEDSVPGYRYYEKRM